MSCEEAKRREEQARKEWGEAFVDMISRRKLGGVTVVVGEDEQRALDEADERYAKADRKWIAALEARLTASHNHRSPSN